VLEWEGGLRLANSASGPVNVKSSASPREEERRGFKKEFRLNWGLLREGVQDSEAERGL